MCFFKTPYSQLKLLRGDRDAEIKDEQAAKLSRSNKWSSTGSLIYDSRMTSSLIFDSGMTANFVHFLLEKNMFDDRLAVKFSRNRLRGL